MGIRVGVGHLDPERHQNIDRPVIVVALDRRAHIGHLHVDAGRLIRLDEHAGVQRRLGTEITGATLDDLLHASRHRPSIGCLRGRNAILSGLNGRKVLARD